ncbi:MAG: hypothetical protein KC615_20830 [Anaerolineae bacterium]|nr:hypothetical protein [Anaerolineae bacterium]
MERFINRLRVLQNERDTKIALFLNPRMTALPLPIQRYDDPFLPYCRAVVEATSDLVCAYVLDFASFMALSAPGARSLERIIGIIGQDTLKILHGPFVGTAFSPMLERTAFDVDAVTLYRAEDVPYYCSNAPYAAFQADTGISGQTVSFTPDLALHVTDDGVLLAGLGDDFAEQIRAALITMRSLHAE